MEKAMPRAAASAHGTREAYSRGAGGMLLRKDDVPGERRPLID